MAINVAMQDLLILDHFLYSFHNPVFVRLRALCDVVKNCEHKQITRPDASYEGIYLLALDGSYFEMLKNPEPTPNIFAQALSSLSPDQQIVPQLSSRYPTLQWSTQQVFDSKNQPWYTYYGQVPMADVQRQGVILWAMQYHNLRRHRPYQYQKKPPAKTNFTIQEFIGARIKVPAQFLDMVRVHSQWVPGNHTISDHKIVLRLLNPSFHDFEVIMEVEREKVESKLVSVSMQLVEEAKIESQQIKGLRLTRLQDKLVINF